MSKIYFPIPTLPHITPPVYPTLVDAGEQSFSFFLKERVLFEPKTGAWFTQSSRREYSREGMFDTGLYMFFTSRITNHHDIRHSRKLQTLSCAFRLCKVESFRGRGI